MKHLLIILFGIILISCNTDRDSEKSKTNSHQPLEASIALNNKALELGFSEDVTDSALTLLDKATKLDPEYFLAYTNKLQFLFIKKDYKRLLKTNSIIQKLAPNNPMWIAQQGIILELQGNKDQAMPLYNTALIEYKKLLEKEQNKCELRIDYAVVMVWAEQRNNAMDLIETAKKQCPQLDIWEVFELSTKSELLNQLK
ncbi:MAG: hypothetical protein HOK72_09365 [Flavobacteriales bacterium]|nr:hypothetical protein [Flavobacteriales bacterium]